MRKISASSFACIAGLVCLSVATARADFVAYNFFGKDVNGTSVNNVTRLGVSPRLYLPAPLYFENFDSGTETLVSSVSGWSATNRTDRITTGLNPNDARSDTYLDWALISFSRLSTVFGNRRLNVAPGQEVNGQPVTKLLSNNLLYAESDLRLPSRATMSLVAVLNRNVRSAALSASLFPQWLGGGVFQ